MGPGAGLREHEQRSEFDVPKSGGSTASNMLAGSLTMTDCAGGGRASLFMPVTSLVLTCQGCGDCICAWATGDPDSAPLLARDGPASGQTVSTGAAVCDCEGCCDDWGIMRIMFNAGT